MMAVHFVGFRTDAEHSAAVKVWGKPDFVHMWNDHRMQGDAEALDLSIGATVRAYGSGVRPSWVSEDIAIDTMLRDQALAEADRIEKSASEPK